MNRSTSEERAALNELFAELCAIPSPSRRERAVADRCIAELERLGLTVTEAMWKGSPVVASRVGGIQDQIVDGRDGLLVDDPHDLEAFATVLGRLLTDPALAQRLGAAGHARALADFLDQLAGANLLSGVSGHVCPHGTNVDDPEADIDCGCS